MYRPVLLPILTDLTVGTRVQLSGRLYRHAQHTTLIAEPHVVRVVGEPLTWLPHHGQAVDVWGELLAGTPPVLLLHGAAPRTHPPRAQAALRPVPGAFKRLVRVSEHGRDLLGTTTDHATYRLTWPGGRAGLYVLTGHVSGLSPPQMSVITATRLWLTDHPFHDPNLSASQECHD